MKIVLLVPGSGGGFYCENCIRDLSLARALRRDGHDVSVVPLYLPLAADEPDGEQGDERVFFGGINVHLQQKTRLFRRTPRWVDRLLDAPTLLRWAARKAGMTRPGDLGETTLSMLRGEQGRQVKELDRLVGFLVGDERPDVVCLSNALLAGLARRIRGALGVPVVCWLQDEDGFLDALPEPLRTESWRILAERAREMDAFAASSRYYADAMMCRLDLPPDRVHVVYPGVDHVGFSPTDRPAGHPTVGFLSRMCRAKGLDVLVEAFVLLKHHPKLAELRLVAAGGKTRADDEYIVAVKARLAEEGLAGHVEILPTLDAPARADMLRRIHVLAAPTRKAEAYSHGAIEALACGTPVVLPNHGAGPEIIEATGGGLLHEPNDPAALADALSRLLLDADLLLHHAGQGRRGVEQRFGLQRAAADFARVCEQTVARAAEDSNEP